MMTRTLTVLVAAITVSALCHSAVGAVPNSIEPQKPMATVEDLPRDARLALYEAQVKIEEGKLDRAADILARWAAEHEQKDDSYLIRYQLAGLYAQIDRPEDALVNFERTVALEPRYAAGWIGVGETAYRLQKYDRAAEALQRGYDQSAQPRPEVLYFSAAARILAGDAAGAIAPLERLTSGDLGEPRFEWYRGLVSACVQAKDADRGKRAVDALIARHGDNPDAWSLVFQYAAGMGDYRQAAVALTAKSYLKPLTRQEQIQLGDLCAAIDAPAAAAQWYVQATADSASAREAERLATAFLASHQLAQARTVLERSVATTPTYKLWSLLGDLNVMEKNYASGYEAFAQCAKLSPDQGRPYLLMGYCALETGRVDEAVASLTIASSHEDLAERAQALLRRVEKAKTATP
jgi:predicted Zn-dependent protease